MGSLGWGPISCFLRGGLQSPCQRVFYKMILGRGRSLVGGIRRAYTKIVPLLGPLGDPLYFLSLIFVIC